MVQSDAALADQGGNCAEATAEPSSHRGALFLREQTDIIHSFCLFLRIVAMVSHSLALPMICFTTLWGLVGVVAPFLVPKGPNRG